MDILLERSTDRKIWCDVPSLDESWVDISLTNEDYGNTLNALLENMIIRGRLYYYRKSNIIRKILS
jgi:hypothetical protein